MNHLVLLSNNYVGGLQHMDWDTLAFYLHCPLFLQPLFGAEMKLYKYRKKMLVDCII